MHRTRQKLVFLFVLGLGFFASLGFAQEVEQSEREASTMASDRRVPPKALFD